MISVVKPSSSKLFLVFLSGLIASNSLAMDLTKVSINPADKIYQSIFLPVLMEDKECPADDLKLWLNESGLNRSQVMEKRIDRKKLAESIGVPFLSEDFDLDKLDEDFENFMSSKRSATNDTVKKCQRFTSSKISLRFMDTIDNRMSAELDALFIHLEESLKSKKFKVNFLKKTTEVCEGMKTSVQDIRDGLTAIIKRCFDKYQGGFTPEAFSKFVCDHYSSQICQILKVRKHGSK